MDPYQLEGMASHLGGHSVAPFITGGTMEGLVSHSPTQAPNSSEMDPMELSPGMEKLIDDICKEVPDIDEIDIENELSWFPSSMTCSPFFNENEPSNLMYESDHQILNTTDDSDTFIGYNVDEKIESHSIHEKLPSQYDNLNTPDVKHADNSFDYCMEHDEDNNEPDKDVDLDSLHKELMLEGDQNILLEAMKTSGLEPNEVPEEVNNLVDSFLIDDAQIDNTQTVEQYEKKFSMTEQLQSTPTIVIPDLLGQKFFPHILKDKVNIVHNETPITNNKPKIMGQSYTENPTNCVAFTNLTTEINSPLVQSSSSIESIHHTPKFQPIVISKKGGFVNQNVPGYFRDKKPLADKKKINVINVRKFNITSRKKANDDIALPSTSTNGPYSCATTTTTTQNILIEEEDFKVSYPSNDTLIQAPNANLSEAEKYRKIREQNNIASRKSRLKRKLQNEQLSEESEELERKNQALKLKYARLLRHKEELNQMFIKYKGRSFFK